MIFHHLIINYYSLLIVNEHLSNKKEYLFKNISIINILINFGVLGKKSRRIGFSNSQN